ncbi:LD-carboxypeptidase [Persicobacter psychrovividus]|uniref:Peptidase S66 n=1 Tax=Persicobacter psychrovividus TaxID=387638 RepID=A0ABN6L4K8_9BACT|nr:peptidase S66 [Persicobacter psychrovividus]
MINAFIAPPKLQIGDQVAIVAISGPVLPEPILRAQAILEQWGLRVLIGRHCFDQEGVFAGSDTNRLSDFQSVLNSAEIKAVFFARGGYGATRILDQVDFSSLMESPKWLIGFSDLTAIHLQMCCLGVQSLHAVMPNSFEREGGERALKSLKTALFDQLMCLEAPAHQANVNGVVNGRLIGGNLSLIVHSIGTASFPDFTGAILFIEDLDEQLYHLDRMMVQLKRAGVLSKISGLIIGQFSDMKQGRFTFGQCAEEIIKAHVSEYAIPISVGLPIGHEADNWAVACGAEAILEVSEQGTKLSFVSEDLP